MKSLYVFYENQRVGVFSRNDNLVSSFTYDEQWQTHENSFPLSLAMPLSQQTFDNKITLSFFENLLPEGDVLDSLERVHNVHGSFEFLERFGQDCAGAVVITPDKSFSYEPSSSPNMKKIDIEEIYEAISKKRSVTDLVSQMEPGYLSLAGAQDKFAAIFKEGKLFLPAHGTASTHIIKTPILRHGIKESVYNEFYCMELARAIGLNVASCEVLEGVYPLFITERYDRIKDEQNVVHRLHQQDFCQAQGVVSEAKYEFKGGPSIKNNYELLNNVTATKRIQALEEFLSWISFNLLIGNNDTHSKNLSLLMVNNKNELAPFYDLLCTSIYESLHKDFSFKIGDRYTFAKIGLNQFTLLEEELGIKRGAFTQRMKDTRELILTHKDSVLEQVMDKHPQAKIPKRISALIAKRAKGLLLQL